MTASGSSSSCGACKFLRRKCTNECVFTPYFCYSQGAHHFAAVHKVFGASNVSKLLMKLPLQNRSEAAISISYEALARMEDPIYGCIAQILALEQQVTILQEEIEQLTSYMAYDPIGLLNYESFQEIGDLNAGLPSSFQFNNTSISDHLNQPLLFAAPHASFF
ncbi:LOB domain-containing protein 29-like [Cynara cardunculus var. scolymus]|uniref:LOB domain-containing protein 29-like n=1 Tax=Cynara cardunculus var. scolymus TaxID=59895 RepID=UPI000D62757F|nr:LOB domain-containing protein 29-like [Cynara cardunculus var. scolymus]